MAVLARVVVMPKPEVNDPQGLTVKHGLTALGFDEVQEVRIGKLIELRLSGSDPAVRERVEAMCRRLLANGVIEDYRFELAAEPAAAAEAGR